MKLLEALNDGEWHTLKEIQQKAKLNENQIQQLIDFLKEYNFITIDEAKKKIKLDETVQKFLAETSTS